MSHQPPRMRDPRLDFFRGLALYFIFLDHIPGNAVAWATVRNFGFSDATEIFVFIAGFAAFVAYSRTSERHGMGFACARVWRRCWELYTTHIILFVLYSAQIAWVVSTYDNPIFADEMNMVGFIEDPHVTLVQALLLKFRPVNMDVLPLYIVLLLGFPLALWLMRRSLGLVLAGSTALWLAARWYDVNLPVYPEGRGWFFNPFAWQFLFILGAAAASRAAWLESLNRVRRLLLPPAVAYLLFAALVALGWRFTMLEGLVPDRLQRWMYPIDKTNLDLLRLLHFAALAYVVTQLVRPQAAFLRRRWARPVIVTGQHSLEVFSLGTLLAFVAHFGLVQSGGGLAAQAAASAAGVLLMTGLAYLLSWYKAMEGAGRGAGAEGRAS